MPEKILFYKDQERKIINPKLFSDVAEIWAKEIHDEGGKEKNKRSQIRKFYDEVLRLNGLVKLNPSDWENILPFVNMLIAKVVYAKGRGHVTDKFVEFIKTCVNQLGKKEDLDIFANYFEAFMGFYRQYRTN